jgi:hypothetical protein
VQGGPGGTYEFSLSVRPLAPGIFTSDGVHAVAALSASPSNLDVLVYATGWNGSPASATTVTVGDRSFEAFSVLSLPGVAGLDLVRVVIPRTSLCGTSFYCGQHLLGMKVGEAQSNRVLLDLRYVPR